MSLLSPLVLSLLLACGEEEAVVEEVPVVVAQPEQPKAPSKKDLLKDFKLKLGQGDVEAASALLADVDEEGSNAAFNLAGGIGWSGASLGLATQHGDWARLVAGDAQGAYDASTDAGMKALAVARGARSTSTIEPSTAPTG